MIPAVIAYDSSHTAGPEAVAYVIVAIIFFGLCWLYFTKTERGRASWAASQAQQKRRAASPNMKPISQVGVQTSAGLACPKCGGTQFQAGRKASTKIAFGAASMLGSAKHVRCVTCGTRYARG